MKRLKTTCLALLSAAILPLGSLGQTFNPIGGHNHSIPDVGSVDIQFDVGPIGIINVAEGKGPILSIYITHPYSADLDITLTSPAGTAVDVSSDNGGFTVSAYDGAIFGHPDATETISNTMPTPFSGPILPEQSFSAFDGESAEGIWTLTVADDLGAYTGNTYFLLLEFGSTGGGSNTGFIRYPLSNDLGEFQYQGTGFGDAGPIVLNGTPATWTEDIHNQPDNALNFDGNGYGEITNSYFPSDAVTIAAWVKPDDVNGDFKILGIADDNNWYDYIGLGILNGELDFEVKDNAYNGQERVSGGTIPANKWTHIAGTWSSNNGIMRIYVNGIEVGQALGAPSVSWEDLTTKKPIIAASAWAPSDHRYSGVIDEIVLVDRRLSEWQIKDLAANYNEYCVTAIDLPVNGTSCDGTYYAHNYAGNGTNGPNPSCGPFGGYSGGTSWFKVVVPASGNVAIKQESIDGSPIWDTDLEVFSGSCGNLTSIDCASNSGTEEIILTGRTPGEVLYVKSWEYNNPRDDQYIICAFEPDFSNVDDISFVNSFNMFPNPAIDEVNLHVELAEVSDLEISLTNMLGQIVYSSLENETNDLQVIIPVNELNTGVYLVTLKAGEQLFTKRLIVE